MAAVEMSNSSAASSRPAKRRRLTFCTHDQLTVDDKLCLECGMQTFEFKYIHEDVRLSKDQISRYRRIDLKKTIGEKKLYLILDLDHTLLHTTHLQNVHTHEMEQFMSSDALLNNLTFDTHTEIVTKLRPFLSDFLKQAGELFQLYIYTMGCRNYAKKMAKLIDPDGSLFQWRVISREDCTVKGKKGLDVVLADEKAVLIVDDTASVWSNHERNLIHVDGFHFFGASGDDLMEETERGDDELMNLLNILKKIHGMFFDPQIDLITPVIDRDVRDYLKIASMEFHS